MGKAIFKNDNWLEINSSSSLASEKSIELVTVRAGIELYLFREEGVVFAILSRLRNASGGMLSAAHLRKRSSDCNAGTRDASAFVTRGSARVECIFQDAPKHFPQGSSHLAPTSGSRRSSPSPIHLGVCLLPVVCLTSHQFVTLCKPITTFPVHLPYARRGRG